MDLVESVAVAFVVPTALRLMFLCCSAFMVDLRINETFQTGAVRKPRLPGGENVYLFLVFTIVTSLVLSVRRTIFAS